MAEPPSPPEPQRFRLTLAGLLVILVVISLSAALLVTVIRAASESADRAACANNLCTLYKATYLYVSGFGNGRDYMPHVGQRFFLCLNGCTDPAHPATYATRSPCGGNAALFLCPATGHKAGIDYLGPRKHTPPGNPSALARGLPADLVIGCDKPGNHKAGGNVLRFDGSAIWSQGSAAYWLDEPSYTEAVQQAE